MKKTVNVAIAPLRAEPSDRSEMVSQALMGAEISVLEQREKWSLVRHETDGYQGWMDNKHWIDAAYDRHTNQLTAVVSRCTTAEGETIWLSAGSRIPVDWTIVDDQPKWSGTADDIEHCAREFMNAPYLWGGRTILGIDCSGFTQLVMGLNGVLLPRDAYQQAELGETVSFLEETQTGDLAFFDNAEGRVTHVGIILRDTSGQSLIIHASGKVRIDLIDHQGIYNRELGQYTHQLRTIKRRAKG